MSWLVTKWKDQSKGIIQSVLGGLVLFAMVAIYNYSYEPIVDFLINLNWLRITWGFFSFVIVVAVCYFAIVLHRMTIKLEKVVTNIKPTDEIAIPGILAGMNKQESRLSKLETNHRELARTLLKHGESLTYSENKTKELEENSESLLKGFEDLSGVVTDTIDRQTLTNESRWKAHNEVIARLADLETLIPSEEILLNYFHAHVTATFDTVRLALCDLGPADRLEGVELNISFHTLWIRGYLKYNVTPQGVIFCLSEKGKNYFETD